MAKRSGNGIPENFWLCGRHRPCLFARSWLSYKSISECWAAKRRNFWKMNSAAAVESGPVICLASLLQRINRLALMTGSSSHTKSIMIKAHYICSARLGGYDSHKLVRKLHGLELRAQRWALGLCGVYGARFWGVVAPCNDNDLPCHRLLQCPLMHASCH